MTLRIHHKQLWLKIILSETIIAAMFKAIFKALSLKRFEMPPFFFMSENALHDVNDARVLISIVSDDRKFPSVQKIICETYKQFA